MVVKGTATLRDGTKVRIESEIKCKKSVRMELTEKAQQKGIIENITVRRYKD
jgi:hypothetical protein